MSLSARDRAFVHVARTFLVGFLLLVCGLTFAHAFTVDPLDHEEHLCPICAWPGGLFLPVALLLLSTIPRLDSLRQSPRPGVLEFVPLARRARDPPLAIS